MSQSLARSPISFFSLYISAPFSPILQVEVGETSPPYRPPSPIQYTYSIHRNVTDLSSRGIASRFPSIKLYTFVVNFSNSFSNHPSWDQHQTVAVLLLLFHQLPNRPERKKITQPRVIQRLFNGSYPSFLWRATAGQMKDQRWIANNPRNVEKQARLSQKQSTAWMWLYFIFHNRNP